MKQQRLRVAVLNRSFVATGGGAERYSIALVEHLAASHEVHVFAQHIEHQHPGVTYHLLPKGVKRPRWVNQWWFAATAWWASRKGFDVVHSHELTFHGKTQVQTVHVLPVKYNLFHERHGLRRVVRWLGVLSSPRLLAYLWLERLRYAPRAGRKVVATSPSLARVMQTSYPQCASMLEVITPGVEAVTPSADPPEQRQARAALGLPPNGTCILWVGNDYGKKGLPALLRAMVGLSADTYLAVVGNPAHIAEHQQLAHNFGVAERVYFLGALSPIYPAYRAADMLAHPTLEDTFAMVVLEAMANGLPVVVSQSRYCGISEYLDDGKNALILQNPADDQALAQALATLQRDPALKARMQREALLFAANHLWSAVARKQASCYRGLLIV